MRRSVLLLAFPCALFLARPAWSQAPPFAMQWGHAGTDTSQFNSARGIALDDSGNVFVADLGNARVQKFTSAGVFITQWSKNSTWRPYGIAFDPASHSLFVADNSADTIVQYSPQGQRLGVTFGGFGNVAGKFSGVAGIAIQNGQIYICDLNNSKIQRVTTAGTFPTILVPPGQVSLPTGVGLDASGNIWVTDAGFSRVDKFSNSGNLLAQYSGSGGSPPTFNNPAGICVDRGGDILVSDLANRRAVRLTNLGQPFTQWGTSGSGPGQFNVPEGIVEAPSGDIYVVDSGNGRIQRFTGSIVDITSAPSSLVFAQQATFQATVTPSTATGFLIFNGASIGGAPVFGGVATVSGLTIVPPGSYQVVAQYNGSPSIGGSHSPPITLVMSPAQTSMSLTASPNPSGPNQPVVCDARISVLPPSNSIGNGNVQFAIDGTNFSSPVPTSGGIATIQIPAGLSTTRTITAAFSGGNDLPSSASIGVAMQSTGLNYSFQGLWGSAGSLGGQISSAAGIATDAAGNLYVADSGNNRVEKFSKSGAFLAAWGGGPGGFNNPTGIAVDGAGAIYVADTNNNRLQKLSSTGAFLLQWGSSGTGAGQFSGPAGVACDGSGNVFVVDSGNSRIQQFTNAGVYETSWGSAGSGDGQLSAPIGIAVDGSGSVYVGDTGNNRVQVFSASGTYLSQWIVPLGPPTYLTSDAAGDVFASASNSGWVEMFAPGGRFINLWGEAGSFSAPFANPLGVAVDNRGFVTMVDSNLGKVERFTPAAAISSLTDVPNDQGHQVRMDFLASLMDIDGSIQPVVRYDVFRQVPTGPLASASAALRAALLRRPIPTPDGVTIDGWDFVGTLNAYTDHAYELVVPTLADSNSGGLNPATFFVRAGTANPAVFYDSKSLTGHSVDNLSPATPLAFTGQSRPNSKLLHWDPNGEPDFSVYRLYRGTTPGFIPNTGNLIATLPDTGYADNYSPSAYYDLSAVDINGNESPPATLYLAAPVSAPGVSPAGLLLLTLGLLGAGSVALVRRSRSSA